MFCLVNGGELLPQRATRYSACFDVFANENVVIEAGETKLIGLGIALAVDSEAACWYLGVSEEYSYDQFMKSHLFELHPRSSLRAKGLGGGVGIIDMDYRDEIKMVVHNPINAYVFGAVYGYVFESGFNLMGSEQFIEKELRETYIKEKSPFEIKKGDKIGQLILCRHEGWLLPSEYTKDEERNGGFGSTNNE